MADCERGLGRPERALELAASPEASRLDLEGRVEMLLVAAGARQDLGQADAAVLTLQVPELTASHKQEWHYRLVSGYAEALALASQDEEAARWQATAARHPAAPDAEDDVQDGTVAYDREGLAQDDPDAYDAAAEVGDFVDLGPGRGRAGRPPGQAGPGLTRPAGPGLTRADGGSTRRRRC